MGLQITKLSRWQVIDRVRELSTEAARTGDGGMYVLVLAIGVCMWVCHVLGSTGNGGRGVWHVL